MVPKEGNLSLSSHAKDLQNGWYTADIYTVPSSTGLLPYVYNPLQFDTLYNLKIKKKLTDVFGGF